MRIGALAAVLALAVSAAWAGPYTLGPEDVLAISVLRHPELSLEITVPADGAITCPVAGQVNVTGKTATEVATAITAGLKSELRDPVVTVVVKTPRPQRVYVNGDVGRPGVCDWKEGWRISEVIAAAGGLTIKPEAARTTIFRAGQEAIEVDLAAVFVSVTPDANVPVLPGDSITVSAKTVRVYVNGQVNKPGIYEMPIGSRAAQAVAVAGGLTQNAAASKAYVLRAGEKLPVDLNQVMQQGEPAADVALQAEDTVNIPENRSSLAIFGRVNRPGYFPIADSRQYTVAEAVGLAGGMDPEADKRKVLVVRNGPDGQPQVLKVDLVEVLEKGKLEQNIALLPSDIVLVTERHSFKPAKWISPLYGLNALRTLTLGF